MSQSVCLNQRAEDVKPNRQARLLEGLYYPTLLKLVLVYFVICIRTPWNIRPLVASLQAFGSRFKLHAAKRRKSEVISECRGGIVPPVFS